MIEVPVGATFDVALEGVPTSGYRWEVSIPEVAQDLVVPLGDEWELSDEWEGSSGRAGGSAVQRFRFRAAAPGEAILTFRYARPWEETTREEREVPVRIAPSD